MTTQPASSAATTPAAAQSPAPRDETNAQGRVAEKIGRKEISRVVIKITGVDDLLEIEGDDVDLGTDLKVRYQHHLVAEFRRDAVDGWWFKTVVLNDGPPFGGVGTASDVGDLSNGVSD